ncbi:MAG: type III-B CRISPR module RAMP protein Cmr6, partial [Elusimicrobiales bacterium]|nr:type III-B CRISPR module RAMP protein Cmr6 [Elusimicrobiales bacterium]
MKAKLLPNVKTVLNQNQNTINPSLYLDKYTGYLEQSEVKNVLKKVVGITRNYNNASIINLLSNLPGKQVKTFECLTPFTIHLSRTTVLENTGICFHPIYGFVYIPGSGIKGLARAYARDILKVDENLILEIFGNENDEKDKNKLRAGKVVFHDAYPVLDHSYKLNVEINNCHHQEYYNGKGEKEPGDWENPNPTYFLSVKPGAKFNFILSLRQDLRDKLTQETNVEIKEKNGEIRKLQNKELVSKAFDFLSGALAYLGLGEKTAAGFGTMAEVKDNGHV